MKKLVSLLAVVFMIIVLVSCSSSMDSDAKKAAELNKQSLNYIKEQNFQKAEKLYKESQEIIAGYKGTDEYEQFRKAYSRYMLGDNNGQID